MCSMCSTSYAVAVPAKGSHVEELPFSRRYSLALVHCFPTIHKVLLDPCRLVLLVTRPRVAVTAETQGKSSQHSETVEKTRTRPDGR